MKCPLVSVVIPNYNHAKYLDQRFQSVLNQTYQNFEVIVLDDKSTDNSLDIINRYIDDCHVSSVVVNNINSGSPFKQWEKGISLAKGEIVWIAESDDCCDLKFLETLVSVFCEREDCSVAYSGVKQFRDSFDTSTLDIKNKETRFFGGEEYIHKYLCLGCTIINASSAIFRREFAQTISQRYADMPAAGDYMFWAEMAMKGSVALVPYDLCYFRRHEGVETDKRSADGSNFIFDKMVFDYLCENIEIPEEEKQVAYAHHALMAFKTKFNDGVFEKVNNAWDIKKQISDYDIPESPDNISSRIFLEAIISKHLTASGIDVSANYGETLAKLTKISFFASLRISIPLLKLSGISIWLKSYKVAIKRLLK